MISVNTVHYADKKVKQKLEFFFDSIENASTIIGISQYHQLENHVSLFEKILHQYSHNIKKYSSKYIGNYLKNDLLSKDDYFLKSKSSRPLVTILNSRQDYKKLNTLIKESIKKLRFRVLKKYLAEVIRIICDKNISPKNSRIEIEYYTNLIVSEFLFNGFSRREIRAIPKMILKGKSKSEIAKYFSEKKLRKYKVKKLSSQIFRINTLCYNPKLELHYVFRVKNLKIEQNEKFRYNGVTFVAPTSKILKKITPKYFRDTYLEFDGSFATQKLIVNNKVDGYNTFLSNLEVALNFLNSIGSVSEKIGNASIEFDNYHVYDTRVRTAERNFSYSGVHLNSRLISHLNKIKSTTGKKGSKRYQQLMRLEKLFFKAQTENDKSEKIIIYWRYLESLFDYQKLKFPKKDKSDFIIKRVSLLLITTEKEAYFKLLKQGMRFVVANFSHKLNLDSLKAYREYLINGKGLNYEKFKTLETAKNHLFLGREIRKIENYRTHTEYAKAQKFYKSILLESYEQRNLLVHNDSPNLKSIIKASLSLEKIIHRIRKIILGRLKDPEFSRLTLSQIIEKISNDGISKLNKK